MTGKQVDHVEKTQQPQQENPFKVVLVNIKKAAKDREIQCIETPLVGGNTALKFVAISYRWGELQEAIVDTGVGYLASVTSFELQDFYDLCDMMTREPDLKDIDYVWVDAICVDQTNMAKRKATIYQMSNIYDRATFIIAVPDLHKRHLTQTSTRNNQIVNSLNDHDRYIYHLIHGHVEQLVKLDEEYLDRIYVPKTDQLRQSLAYYTDHFADGIMKYKVHQADYNPKNALKDIQKAILDSHKSECRQDFTKIYHTMEYEPTNDFDRMIYYNEDDLEGKKCLHKGLDIKLDHLDPTMKQQPNDKSMPQDWFQSIMKEIKHDEWKQRISERVDCIQELMDFFKDIVKDWATRVWVISEYSIAKKDNKMKYWFLHLGLQDYDQVSFFKLNFLDTLNKQDNCIFANGSKFHALTAKCDDIYQEFQQTMTHQLLQQTFLEMMLKSKASKNEDRFYAILPMSIYKNKLLDKHDFDRWSISGSTSVKLKLYDMMRTEDKLALLFLSATCRTANFVLPTFASSHIVWPNDGDESIALKEDVFPCNFDLKNPSTIVLHHLDPKITYKLCVKPKEFYICADFKGEQHRLSFFKKQEWIRKQLGLESTDALCVVRIPCYGQSVMDKCDEDFYDTIPDPVHLIGTNVKNKWIMISTVAYSFEWIHHFNKNNFGFDIY